MSGLHAVVLAGGPFDDVARLQNVPNKAFVEIEGVTLVGRVLLSLSQASRIASVCVVAPETMYDSDALALATERRPDGPRITDSLRNGLAGLPGDDSVLIVTSDLPVLSPEAVDDFVERVRSSDPDAGYGCVDRRTHEARFPQVPHTWARLRDGTFCGAGLASLKPRALPALEQFIERLGAARKRPLQLASIFGYDVLVRFAFGRLTIARAEERASRILGAKVRAIVSPFADAGVNVDRVGDVALARDLLREAAGATNASV
ncbi:MAG TPA: NTP transferase domain-containing protein [Candidatus Acidoferrum sp.]|nr:NTP transferase domain-containing protein [Candidatus Acidoferrum sp.]